MHLSLTILTTSAALASAQFIYNSSTHMLICPSTPANGAYCTGPSLSSSIIIRCTGTEGVAGNCNDNLAGVPPIGVKGFAPCYESSITAGDAACSYGGIVYPENGPSFAIPGPGSSGNNTSASSTATAAARNASLTVIPSTSTSNFTTSSSTPAVIGYTPFADLATLLAAPYPIPSATNRTAAASGTGTAPRKMGGWSGPTFTGAAGRMTEVTMGAIFATFVANAAAFGLMLLL